MRGRDLVKGTIGIMTSFGTGTIVANIIKATTPPIVSVPVRACTLMASLVIAGMAGETVGSCAERWIDEILDGPKTEKPKLVVVQ